MKHSGTRHRALRRWISLAAVGATAGIAVGVTTLASTGAIPTPAAAAPGMVSVGSMVFNDRNNDGIKQGTEGGVTGAALSIYVDEVAPFGVPDNGTAVQQMNSDINGKYNFSNLTPGKYVIEMTPPAPWVGSTGTQGNGSSGPYEPGAAETPNADDKDHGTRVVSVIRSGQLDLQLGTEPTGELDIDPSGTADADSNFTIDFGLFRPLSLGGTVFSDIDGDGLHGTGEGGLANIDVCLFPPGAAPGGGPPLLVTQTDSQGRYRFTTNLTGNPTYLGEGDYMVVLVKASLPAGVTSSVMNESANPNNNTDKDDNGVNDNGVWITTGTMTLNALQEPVGEADASFDPVFDGDSNMTMDFGFIPAGGPVTTTTTTTTTAATTTTTAATTTTTAATTTTSATTTTTSATTTTAPGATTTTAATTTTTTTPNGGGNGGNGGGGLDLPDLDFNPAVTLLPPAPPATNPPATNPPATNPAATTPPTSGNGGGSATTAPIDQPVGGSGSSGSNNGGSNNGGSNNGGSGTGGATGPTTTINIIQVPPPSTAAAPSSTVAPTSTAPTSSSAAPTTGQAGQSGPTTSVAGSPTTAGRTTALSVACGSFAADQNGNGRRDPGEPALTGVTLRVFGNGIDVQSTTDADGRFCAELPEGEYSIQVTQGLTPEFSSLAGKTLRFQVKGNQFLRTASPSTEPAPAAVPQPTQAPAEQPETADAEPLALTGRNIVTMLFFSMAFVVLGAAMLRGGRKVREA